MGQVAEMDTALANAGILLENNQERARLAGRMALIAQLDDVELVMDYILRVRGEEGAVDFFLRTWKEDGWSFLLKRAQASEDALRQGARAPGQTDIDNDMARKSAEEKARFKEQDCSLRAYQMLLHGHYEGALDNPAMLSTDAVRDRISSLLGKPVSKEKLLEMVTIGAEMVSIDTPKTIAHLLTGQMDPTRSRADASLWLIYWKQSAYPQGWKPKSPRNAKRIDRIKQVAAELGEQTAPEPKEKVSLTGSA